MCTFRNASQNEDPLYNEYFFHAGNRQTRPQENPAGSPLPDVGRTQIPPPPLYPYPMYQNPLGGPSNSFPYHLEQVRDTDSPGEESSGSDERSKRKSWSVVEEKCLIATYKELHDALKSTKSSHGKKTIWERTLKKIPTDVLGKWRRDR